MYFPQSFNDESISYEYDYPKSCSIQTYSDSFCLGQTNAPCEFSHYQNYMYDYSAYNYSPSLTSRSMTSLAMKQQHQFSTPTTSNFVYTLPAYDLSINNSQLSNDSAYVTQPIGTRKRLRDEESIEVIQEEPKKAKVDRIDELKNANKYCSTCKYEFNTVADYIMHEAVQHRAQSNKQCPICAKSFSTPMNALTHVKHHTSERQHKCNKCDKSFFDLSSLQKHLNIHAERKPYVCHLCNKDFAQKVNLKKHLVTRHP